MGLCIIMLKHEVMAVDEWHDNGPQGLITVSLCIQMSIDRMQMYSLSIAHACPYHSLNPTVGHSVHNVDISKPTRHLSAICPLQLKPGLVREVHTSPACQWPSKVNHFPTEVGYDTELQSGQDPSEDNKHADELT
jgi:hypothetical protein